MLIGLLLLLPACGNAPTETAATAFQKTQPPFSLDELQRRTFNYFWELADPNNFQISDRYPTETFSSIAATGFGLTGYLVGVERGYISRKEAAERVLQTLRVLKNLPQGDAPKGMSGHRGFFYHFLKNDDATRYKNVELSTMDTGLLMAGILSARSFFAEKNEAENEIRELADFLYRRVEWDWALNENGRLSMGWRPESGFIESDWRGYNEAMILLLLAMGSPTHPIPAESWEEWCGTYEWAGFQGQEFVQFHSLFGHQYSQLYIDFRGIQDGYMRQKGIDYFENSRRATLANHSYCTANPKGFKGYAENCWGLTACDGPRNQQADTSIGKWLFKGYAARGVSPSYAFDDGTISPTAAGGSIAFAPEICLPALRFMWEHFYPKLVGEYGFKDAFNLSYTFGEGNKNGWFDKDYIGIDQGPILLQTENHRSGFVWGLMKKNEYLKRGLERAGFEPLR
ncbi:MAG TPA: Tat pathway signal protein [Bacteroidetes bacterium]|nr:Tat pathway signal protein [Bacteroidota bacterium]